MTSMTSKYTAAIYCRLSQDDGSVGESGSIQTQKTLLTQHCADKHITIGNYYCDDGWSGTNFDRPDFKRMIDYIEAGENKHGHRKGPLPLRARVRANGNVYRALL